MTTAAIKALLIFSLCCLFYPAAGNGAEGKIMEVNKEKESASLIAANRWLEKVDSGKYSESWSSTAQFFKNSVTKKEWDRTLNAVRKPLGKVESRKTKNKNILN